MIVVDTGPLVAISDAGDAAHQPCLDALGSAQPPIVVPTTVLAEVCYMLERNLGTAAEAAYADLPLGAVDASVVAVAERLGVTTIATLDRRHFGVVRPRGRDAFALVPY